jgi:tRNA-dihydrouridine synthase
MLHCCSLNLKSSRLLLSASSSAFLSINLGMSNKRTFSAMQGDGKEQEWSYWNKTILAPMVRVGTLPFRRLATSYGADIVYSEEIIDKRIMKCTRVEDKKTGLVSFRYVEPRTTKTKKPLPVQNTFITFPGENVVFQMGTSNAENALKAARIVEHDVRAIDVNMGCPKHFSVHAGMGCALLINPDNVRSILSTLVENLSIPVTCKIRLLDSVEETVALCKVALECKVAALAIHGRRPVDRPRHKAMPELVKEVFSRLREESELARNTPLIYNGDVTYNHQMAEFKEPTPSWSRAGPCGTRVYSIPPRWRLCGRCAWPTWLRPSRWTTGSQTPSSCCSRCCRATSGLRRATKN